MMVAGALLDFQVFSAPTTFDINAQEINIYEIFKNSFY